MGNSGEGAVRPDHQHKYITLSTLKQDFDEKPPYSLDFTRFSLFRGSVKSVSPLEPVTSGSLLEVFNTL